MKGKNVEYDQKETLSAAVLPPKLWFRLKVLQPRDKFQLNYQKSSGVEDPAVGKYNLRES